MRAFLVAAIWLGLTAAACGSAAPHSRSQRAPGSQPGHTTTASQTSPGAGQTSDGAAGNSFRGSVASASGAYAGEGGRVEVTLQARGSGVSRPITLVFRSLPCRGAPQCVQLDGALTGHIVARPGGPPDTGRSFTITAAGRLTTLGHVSAAGIEHGTGFIARGHELLDLALTSRSGRIALRTLSGSVGGFSSP
jgi:hypothetical protein